jgi:hypothetical protein
MQRGKELPAYQGALPNRPEDSQGTENSRFQVLHQKEMIVPLIWRDTTLSPDAPASSCIEPIEISFFMLANSELWAVDCAIAQMQPNRTGVNVTIVIKARRLNVLPTRSPYPVVDCELFSAPLPTHGSTTRSVIAC